MNVRSLEAEVERLRTDLARRNAFLTAVDADNDAEPFDQADERRRLVLALEALDTDDLGMAAAVPDGTQSHIAREFLLREALATDERGEG